MSLGNHDAWKTRAPDDIPSVPENDPLEELHIDWIHHYDDCPNCKPYVPCPIGQKIQDQMQAIIEAEEPS